MGALFFAKKKTRSTRSICFAAGVAVSLLLAQSCSKTNLLAPLVRMQVINNQTQAVTVNFCTDPAVQEKFVVKMLVILDHSGSNQNNFVMNTNGDGTPEIFSPVCSDGTTSYPCDGNSTLTSGSIEVSPTYATDPTGSLRYGSITQTGTLLNYLGTLPANDPTNPQHYFALIDFNSSIKTIPNPSPSNPAPFMSDVQGFYTAVNADLNCVTSTCNGNATSDTQGTDYHAALNQAYSMIQADITQATACAAESTSTPPSATCATPGQQVTSSYVIVFASDGSPFVGNLTVDSTTTLGNLTTYGVDGTGLASFDGSRESNQQIINDVQGIMALSSNTTYVSGINMFTVYYYNPDNNIDQSGQSLLAAMAKAGNGLSYSAVSGTQLNYNQFLPLTKTIKYTLSDIFVTNASVLWWTDGQLHADTDMDGLPDDVELAWGSDPLHKDTFGYGISDSVTYQLGNGANCGNKNGKGFCTTTATGGSLNYPTGTVSCAGSGLSHTTAASSTTVSGSQVTWAATTSDPDGMNACEKVLLGDTGGIGIPDSNNDIIPDWLEFINGTPFQLSAPSAANSVQSDGMTAYQKIKYSLPANYPLTQLLNVQASNYNLTQTSTSSTQDCYNLVVTGLPVIGEQNTVRVDVVEKSELLQGKYLYKVGKKAFPLGSQSVQFNDWNNPAEQAAGTWSIWSQ
jgi:hypothetical protein